MIRTIKKFGLENLGNTCFFNATLQALLTIPDLNEYICKPDLWKELYDQNVQHKQDVSLIRGLYLLMKELYSPNQIYQALTPIVNPLLIFNAIRFHKEYYKGKIERPYSYFSIGIQNDAYDMFNAFLNVLHDETKEEDNTVTIKNPIFQKLDPIYHDYDLNNGDIPYRYDEILYFNYRILQKMYSKEYSKLTSRFTSSIVNITECAVDGCGNKTFGVMETNVYELNLIDADIKEKENLHDLTEYMNNQLTETEYIENHSHRKATGHLRCYNYHRFWRIPQILIIRLKRFAIIDGREQKLNYPINIPERFDISPYIHLYAKNERCNMNTTYQLLATVQHRGGVNGGHYFTYGIRENRWFELNDSSATPIDRPDHSQSYFVIYKRI